jgi:hypothetical protein
VVSPCKLDQRVAPFSSIRPAIEDDETAKIA